MLSLGIVSSKACLSHGDGRKQNRKRKIQLCPADLAPMSPLALKALEAGQRERHFTLSVSATLTVGHISWLCTHKGGCWVELRSPLARSVYLFVLLSVSLFKEDI